MTEIAAPVIAKKREDQSTGSSSSSSHRLLLAGHGVKGPEAPDNNMYLSIPFNNELA
jgi:hypothetical protein